MPTAMILGEEYRTVLMPDGKEWMAQNLRRSDFGMIVPGDGEAELQAYGRGYLPEEFLSWTDLPDGWHVPTKAEWESLFLSMGAYIDAMLMWHPAGTLLKEAGTDHWNATSVPGEDTYGFGVTGSGYWIGPPYYDDWNRKSRTGLASSTTSSGNLTTYQFISGPTDLDYVESARQVNASLTPYVPPRYGVRLLRDGPPPPPPFTGPCAESVEVSYALAIEWGDAIDGTPFAIDDGAQYDAVSSVITLRLLPAELTALEAIYQSATPVWTIEGSGYLLGPEIDHQDGVDVTITDLVVDGPADAAQTLFDVTVTIHYAGPLPEPTIGSADLVHASGIGYHTTEPLNRVWRTAEGGLDASTYTRESTRRMVWYSDGYSTDQALELINYLRTNRADKTYWPSFGPLFGPGEDDDAYVWIRGWRVLRSSNLTWGFELEVVRDG